MIGGNKYLRLSFLVTVSMVAMILSVFCSDENDILPLGINRVRIQPPFPSGCCGEECQILFDDSSAAGWSCYWAGLLKDDQLLAYNYGFCRSPKFGDQPIWLKYNYTQLSGPGYYDVKVFACSTYESVGNLDAVTKGSGPVSISIAGWDPEDCLDSCCTSGMDHGYSEIVMRHDGLTGASARLETRLGKLCRQNYYASDTAFSVISVGVAFHHPDSGTIWAQIGCGIQRSHFGELQSYIPYVYGELVDYSQKSRYIFEPGIVGDGDVHSYEITLDHSTGTWSFYFNDESIGTLQSNDWKRTGNWCQWGGEVLNWEDDMAGTDSERCGITQCQFRDVTYQDANFDDASSYFIDITNDEQWGLYVIDQNSFEIWDKHTIP